MSEPFVYDPRCDLCKTPFGAVECGAAVTFHCRPLLSEGFTHCSITLHREFSGQPGNCGAFQASHGRRPRPLLHLPARSPGAGAGVVSLFFLA